MSGRLQAAVLCCLALLFAGARGDRPQTGLQQPVTLPDSYAELYRQELANVPADRKGSPHEAVAVSEAALRLWLATREDAFRRRALPGFERLLSDPKFDLKDFHTLQGFGRLVLLLRQHRLVRPQDEPRLRETAAAQLAAFCKSADNSDHNIRLAQALGYACLLKFLEGQPYPGREAAYQRLDAYWTPIRRTEDLDEDAANYDSLGLVFLVDLARVMGWEEDLRRSPGFRRAFERCRETVSPTGLLPEYGDSYFSSTGCPLDRVYLLEYAARLYDDPTFLDAARRLYRRPQAALPGLDVWYRAMPLINLDRSPAAPRVPVGPASLVTYRARRDSDRPLVDKLILRTGRDPGAAMVLLDLYAAGSHAHPEKGPSVAYYEVDHVPLFHNLGRHRARSAITGNLFWGMPGAERFPGCWNQENTWFTMTLPADYLTRQGDRFVLAPALSLRNFQERNRQCRYLFFDNLRLEGPSGVRLVDAFEDPSRWDVRLTKATEVVLSREHTQGSSSERVAWRAVPSAELGRKLPDRPQEPFRKDKYGVLKLDLKYVGARPYMHVRGLGKQVDLGDQLLLSELAGARAEQRGRDAYGRVEYRTYLTPDSILTRHLLLTAEGCLVLHDVLTPGPSMKGWNAGQLWQLYALKARGEDWFCSEDDGGYQAGPGAAPKTRRMLVRFAGGAGTEAGVEEVRQEYHCPNPRGRPAERFFTTFCRRQVVPGRKESFTMAVLPHDPAEGEPAAVADCLRVREGAVSIGSAGRRPQVEVRIGAAGWEVKR